MTDDTESTLSPAQDYGSDDLSSIIADAFAESGGSDDTDEPTDDAGDSPEPEGDGGEAEDSDDDGDGAGQADEADPQAAAADQEAASGPDRDAKMAGAYRQVAEAFNGVASPYTAYLASKGVTAPQAFQVLLAAEHQLSTGTPERKAQIISQLAKDYGVDVDSLYELDTREPPSPEIAQIQQRQAVLERHIQGERARVQAEQAQANTQLRQSVETEVAAFASEKDSSGALIRPHLKEVRDEMGHQIARDHNLSIQEAYDNAVWANPKLREANLAKRTAPAGQSAKATKARPAPKTPSLRDDLQRVYKRAAERAGT